MNKFKTYYEYMEEISDVNLMEGMFLEGYFPRQLPPIFQSYEFYDLYEPDFNNLSDFYIKDYNNKTSNNIIFETMRNINIPRVINIPNPFIYFNQCLCLSENWHYIKEHFQTYTLYDTYKISQNHIRKSKNTKKLIDAKSYIYKDLETNQDIKKYIKSKDNENFNLKFLSKYKVEIDISRCFPSIYTHSIAWALVGKEKAKSESGSKFNGEYFNRLDKYTRNLNDGETYGIMVGPHSSNLISEIILVRIDYELSQKWKYTRYIDDYTCYVYSEEKAQEFIIDVTNELRKYNLSLNHRKTKITKLPIINNNWTYKMKNFIPFIMKENTKGYGAINFIEVKDYLEMAKKLALEEENNAILNYGIKVVSDLKLTKNAEMYFIYEVLGLAYIYPYLIPLLDESLFEKYKNSYFSSKTGKKLFENACNEIYKENLKNMNFEAVSYSIYYALKYNLELDALKFEDLKNSESPIIYILGYLYSKKYIDLNNQEVDYLRLARTICGLDPEDEKNKIDLNDRNFQDNWIFVYEVLSDRQLPDSWANIKKKKISFLKKEYR